MITILLFAGLKESIGQEQIAYPHGPITVSELLARLSEEYPSVRFSGIMVAVNEQYAGPEETIEPGSIVALIPPVSGG